MKVFFYIDSMQLGGANRVMANLANHFSEYDNEVTLLNDIAPDPQKPEYQVSVDVRRVYLDSQMNGNESRIQKSIIRIRNLRNLIKTEKPDIVVSFMGPPNIRMLLASVGLKTRKIVSVRNDPYKEYGSGIHKTISRMIFRLADGCVFQTEDAARYFPRAVQKKSKVIFNPVNEKFYHQELLPEEKTVVMVGRLQPQKNTQLAIRAFAQVASDHPDYSLVLYGDGELKQSLQNLTQELGISEQVVFAGQVSNVEEKLASAAIYLLSSDFEGMPNALMEAMAVGVPCISTDCPCGGPRTLIQNEKQGILVPVGDCKKMSLALNKLMGDPELRNAMRNGGRNGTQFFRPEVIYDQWERFIFQSAN